MKVAALALGCVAIVARAGHAQPRQPGWEVRVADKVALSSGDSGSISIAIAVDRGLTVSKDASVLVDLFPAPGVTIRKKRLARTDAVDPEADAPRFSVTVKADTAGEHTVKVRVRFWLCGGKVCKPIDVRRQAIVSVAPPAAPRPDAGVTP